MTRDQAELERAWLAECRGVAKGATIAAGIIALGEWARRTSREMALRPFLPKGNCQCDCPWPCPEHEAVCNVCGAGGGGTVALMPLPEGNGHLCQECAES